MFSEICICAITTVRYVSHSNKLFVNYLIVPVGLCGEKSEIMRFEKGKLCFKNDELFAKL